MQSSGMWRRVVLVRTDVSEERIAYIIRATRVGDIGTTLALTKNRSTLRHPDDRDDKFLPNVGSYKSHAGSHPRKRHSPDYTLIAL
jgi:hypothetical protein